MRASREKSKVRSLMRIEIFILLDICLLEPSPVDFPYVYQLSSDLRSNKVCYDKYA